MSAGIAGVDIGAVGEAKTRVYDPVRVLPRDLRRHRRVRAAEHHFQLRSEAEYALVEAHRLAAIAVERQIGNGLRHDDSLRRNVVADPQGSCCHRASSLTGRMAGSEFDGGAKILLS